MRAAIDEQLIKLRADAMTVDYEWRLRLLMAEHGMFKATDLQPRLAEHGIEPLGLAGLATSHRTPRATEPEGAGRAL